MATPPKAVRLTPYIGTHDGTFHCDDVTACFMLKQLARFKDHEIVRTRKPEILNDAEIIVDVGSELDVEKLRLDHHQRSFNQTIIDYHPNLKVTNPSKPPRLSSSGLVFALFGKEVIIEIIGLKKPYDSLSEVDKKMVDAIYNKSYIEFFEEIDAIDNGVEIASGQNVVYNYHVNSGISSRVARMNPRSENASAEERLVQFKKAMDMVGAEIIEGIQFLSSEWWPARQQFKELVVQRKEFDPSGHTVFMGTKQLTGWKSALFELEEELNIVGQLLFVVYCDNSEASPWRVITIPVEPKSFSPRKPLHEDWRGKRDEDLQSVSGVSDAVFVHMSGFTGGAKSLEGVKELIRKTID